MKHEARSKKLKIVFLGNTKYSTIGAQILYQSFPISLVVTIPDKPTGRKKTLTPSPVKLIAQRLKIPVLEAEKLTPDIIQAIAEYKPDFLVVEDYGLILPQTLLDIPKYQPLNVHHSLLPKFRGPSPAPSAILAGEKVSGVTIISMTNKVDAGDIFAQQEYTLTREETTDSLLTKLNTLGGQLVTDVIQKYIGGQTQPIPQDESKVTFTKFIKKEEGYFDIESPPPSDQLDRMIRAYYPWPNAWTKWNGRIVKFLPQSRHPEEPASSGSFLVQIEGKKPVLLKDFLNGYPGFPLKNF